MPIESTVVSFLPVAPTQLPDRKRVAKSAIYVYIKEIYRMSSLMYDVYDRCVVRFQIGRYLIRTLSNTI